MITTEVRQVVAEALAADREVRAVAPSGFKLIRADAAGDSDALTLLGYASVFETPYEMYGGPPFGWNEIVDQGAFDKTLREKPDVQLLINHDGMPLARTKSGTLTLSADRVGLVTSADLEPRSATVQELSIAMDRGDIDEMSFAFRVLRQEWNEDYTERRLLEVSIHKGDVSVVNFGANPATSATLRAMSLASVAGMDPGAVLAEMRSAGIVDLATIAAARDVLTRALDTPTAKPAPPVAISLAEARRLLEPLTA